MRFCGVFLIILLTPTIALAGLTYQPLVGIPGVDNASSNFNQYINQLYFVSISIAALLAVIKIIIGGVKWMLTDVVTQKSDAKDDIRSALLGLLLIIAAYLILSTINPQLTNLNVLQDAPGVRLAQPQTVPPPVIVQNPEANQGVNQVPENASGETIANERAGCERRGGQYRLQTTGNYSCVTPTSEFQQHLTSTLPAGTNLNQNIVANLTPHYVPDQDTARAMAARDLIVNQGIPGATANNVYLVVQVPQDQSRVALVRESTATVCRSYNTNASVLQTTNVDGSRYFYCARP